MTDVVSIAHHVLEYQQWRANGLMSMGLRARAGYEQIMANRRGERAAETLAKINSESHFFDAPLRELESV